MAAIISLDPDVQVVVGLGDLCRQYLTTPPPDPDPVDPMPSPDIPTSPTVIRGYVNRVSKPKSTNYIVITPLAMARLSTNAHTWDGVTRPDDDPSAGTQGIRQSVRRRVQIDCYGVDSATWAYTLSTLLRDAEGCRYLAPYGLAPLYTVDPVDMTQPDGREQYERRYMVEAMLQAHIQVTVPLDYFHDVNLILRPQL